jgi:serine/threonine protein kinase
MRYVHSHGILHLDLKPANILLDADFRGKISDFGLSQPYDSEDPARGPIGTYQYSAPEQTREDFRPTTKTDVFAFGLVLFEILSGNPVFAPSLSSWQIVGLHRKHYRPPIPSQFGPLMRRLIRKCWSRSPESRPSFEDIFTEFESVGFEIVPNANGSDIAAAVSKVIAWEQGSERTT